MTVNLLYDCIDPIEGPVENLKTIFYNTRKRKNVPTWSFLNKEDVNIVPSYFCDNLDNWFYPIQIYRPMNYINEFLTGNLFLGPSEDHFFYRLSPKIQKSLKNNKGWVLIELYEPISKPVFDLLKFNIENNKEIPFNRFLFITCSVVNHKNWLDIPMFYHTHLQYEPHESNDLQDRKIFCCFNASLEKQKHRKDLIKALEKLDLNKHGYVSVKNSDEYRNTYNKLPVTVLNNVDINLSIETFFKLNYKNDFYSMETLPLISERTMRNFLFKKPFLTIGYKGILKDIKDKGYQTFPEIFDEAYDNEEDDYKRMILVIKELKRFSNLSQQDRDSALSSVTDKLQHNHKHFMNKVSLANITKKLTEIQNRNSVDV